MHRRLAVRFHHRPCLLSTLMAFDVWPPLFRYGKDDNEWMENEERERQ